MTTPETQAAPAEAAPEPAQDAPEAGSDAETARALGVEELWLRLTAPLPDCSPPRYLDDQPSIREALRASGAQAADAVRDAMSEAAEAARRAGARVHGRLDDYLRPDWPAAAPAPAEVQPAAPEALPAGTLAEGDTIRLAATGTYPAKDATLRVGAWQEPMAGLAPEVLDAQDAGRLRLEQERTAAKLAARHEKYYADRPDPAAAGIVADAPPPDGWTQKQWDRPDLWGPGAGGHPCWIGPADAYVPAELPPYPAVAEAGTPPEPDDARGVGSTAEPGPVLEPGEDAPVSKPGAEDAAAGEAVPAAADEPADADAPAETGTDAPGTTAGETSTTT
jgi:hypothetical protein